MIKLLIHHIFTFKYISKTFAQMKKKTYNGQTFTYPCINHGLPVYSVPQGVYVTPRPMGSQAFSVFLKQLVEFFAELIREGSPLCQTAYYSLLYYSEKVRSKPY